MILRKFLKHRPIIIISPELLFEAIYVQPLHGYKATGKLRLRMINGINNQSARTKVELNIIK